MIEFLLFCFIPTYVNSSHMFIVFLILNSWETDLQKPIEFLLKSFLYFKLSVCELLVLYVHMLLYKINKSLNYYFDDSIH